jgi:hypothetical protein
MIVQEEIGQKIQIIIQEVQIIGVVKEVQVELHLIREEGFS